MKHLNQINTALVILSLGVVFYSLSHTFFNRQESLVQVVSSSAVLDPEEDPDSISDTSPPEVRNPRNYPITSGRPGNREASAAPNRRGPATSGSPQIFSPSANPGGERSATNPSPSRILTTPNPTRGDRNLPNTPTPVRIQEPDDDQGQQFQEAVERMREQGGVPRRPSSRVDRPPGTTGPTTNQGLRRQATPPPARSSMSNQRPPR